MLRYTFSRRLVKRQRRKTKPVLSLEQIAVDASQSTLRASKKNPAAALGGTETGWIRKGIEQL
jgi:hypothetical protein